MIAEPGEAWQDWMKSAADFQVMREGLEASGLSGAQTDQVMGGNFLRLFGQTFAAGQARLSRRSSRC